MCSFKLHPPNKGKIIPHFTSDYERNNPQGQVAALNTKTPLIRTQPTPPSYIKNKTTNS